MKTIATLVLILIGCSGFSQDELNEYKYIIVPKKFETFKYENQYQTSTLLKYLFIQKGFTAVYDDDLPEDLLNNRCLGLVANIYDGSTMFKTKSTVLLLDCEGNEVFKTKEGISNDKGYKSAWNEAINESMSSFNGMEYSYKEKTQMKSEEKPIVVSFKNDVKSIDEDSIDEEQRIVTKKIESTEKVESKNKMIVQEATTSKQLYKDGTPVTSTIKKGFDTSISNKTEIEDATGSEVWYAQSIDNGYQLVDSSPKVTMKLLKSSIDNVFMAQTDTQNGMVYKKENTWIFEYYDNGQLVQKELTLKF